MPMGKYANMVFQNYKEAYDELREEIFLLREEMVGLRKRLLIHGEKRSLSDLELGHLNGMTYSRDMLQKILDDFPEKPLEEEEKKDAVPEGQLELPFSPP